MTDLVMDLQCATKHPQQLMRDLGITYKLAVPQSMGGCWWFFGCENVPDYLPACLSLRDFGDLNQLVGFGLSQADADMLMGESM